MKPFINEKTIMCIVDAEAITREADNAIQEEFLGQELQVFTECIVVAVKGAQRKVSGDQEPFPDLKMKFPWKMIDDETDFSIGDNYKGAVNEDKVE